jgi:uncharacterized protein
LWILIIIAMILYCIYQDNDIVTTKIEYENKKIPVGFNGFVIAQVSDLHNKRFGSGGAQLLEKIRNISPDIIVITGDIIDRRRYDPDTAMAFIDGALKIAPLYFAPGNHEAWSKRYHSIESALQSRRVIILNNASEELTRGGDVINIIGLTDPAFSMKNHKEKLNPVLMERYLHSLPKSAAAFVIALSHRPELLQLYSENDLDLVFCGHAHGGQIRLPLLGGLYAPSQGILPKYTSGKYTQRNTSMIVSRGLGNSSFPIRINNRPQLIAVRLVSADNKSAAGSGRV